MPANNPAAYGNTTDPQQDNFLGYPGFTPPGTPPRGEGVMDALNFYINKLGRGSADGRSFFSPQFEFLSNLQDNGNFLDPTSGGQNPGNQGIFANRSGNPWTDFQNAFPQQQGRVFDEAREQIGQVNRFGKLNNIEDYIGYIQNSRKYPGIVN